MSRLLYLIGHHAARRPWVVIASWFALAVLVIGASGVYGHKLGDSLTAPGLDSQRATDLLAAAHADAAGLTAEVVVTPLDHGATLRTDVGRAALGRITTAATRLPHVLGTIGPARVSPDGRVAIIRLQYPDANRLSAKDLDNLNALVAASTADRTVQVEAGGDLFSAFDKGQTDLGEALGLLVAAIVLLLAFGSVIAMGLPIGMALAGLAVGTGAMGLVALLIDVPSYAPILGSMVGLGVGIDYALLIVTRHRGFLADGMTVAEAAGNALATAGQSVVFAGGTVVVAILGLGVSGVPFLTAGGVAIALVVLIMVAASLTLLPALLGLAKHRIDGRRGRRARILTVGTTERRWARWGAHVCRHPWPYAIGTTLTLVALAAPVLGLHVGMPDQGTLPTERTERRAYDLVARGFGAGVNGPLVVAVDVSGGTGVLGPLRAAIAADRGIAGVAPADVHGGVAALVAFPTTGPQDDATAATIRRLRADVLPPALANTSAVAHVGGRTASFVDIGQRVQDRLPVLIAAVVGLSFLLLMVVFRSILVPLKAALLNLLGVGAAYGVLVMVFQWGWGASLIGLHTTIPIVSVLPMFMFAILFGLSMDYEVFLLSRIREEYLASGDATASVIAGLAGTARVITSAALIMISVFLGFVVGNDPSTKMFGLGLAVAILIDATLVRMVLAPATMRLLGDANWWLPAWLDRLLPSIGDGHSARASAPGQTSTGPAAA
jgi:RND superfamily putative drug exporter